MGVVIASKKPGEDSKCAEFDPPVLYHDYATVPLCPIFILFEETTKGDYKPFHDGIEGMIRAIFSNTSIGMTYI